AALEQTSRAQIERMSHAAQVGAQQFREAMGVMIGEVDGLTKTLADKVVEHNAAIKSVLRSESEEFTAGAERAAQLFGRRIVELVQELDGASDKVRGKTEGLQALANNQGERLATVADQAGQRFRAEIDLQEQRYLAVNEAAANQARGLADAVD